MDKVPVSTKVARCPTCRKPTVPEYRPFCSKRCADIDLSRWLGGGYVIAGSSLDVTDDSSLTDDGTLAPGSRPPADRDEDN